MACLRDEVRACERCADIELDTHNDLCQLPLSAYGLSEMNEGIATRDCGPATKVAGYLNEVRLRGLGSSKVAEGRLCLRSRDFSRQA